MEQIFLHTNQTIFSVNYKKVELQFLISIISINVKTNGYNDPIKYLRISLLKKL